MKKRNLLSVCILSGLLLFSPPGICSAATAAPEQVYQITGTELTQLESRLAQLKNDRAQLLIQLDKLQAQQATLEKQLVQLKALSQTQETQLQIANESLAKYAQEAQLKQTSLRRERTFWIIGCSLAIAAVLAK